MFIFGHLGFGSAIARPWKKSFTTVPFLVGTLLPDLIDKPIFYLHLSFVGGSRSFGHTLLFLLVLLSLARVLESRSLFSIAVGVLTHLVLDNVGDLLIVDHPVKASLHTLFWPLEGFDFPATLYLTMQSQFHRLSSPYLLVTEAVGLVFIILFYFTNGLARALPRRFRRSKPKHDLD